MWHGGFKDEIEFDDVTDSDDEYSTPPELDNSVVQGPTRPRTTPRNIPRTMPRNNVFLDEGDGTWVGEQSPPPREWIGDTSRLLYRDDRPPSPAWTEPYWWVD